MDIHTAAKYMELGYRIKRSRWPSFLYVTKVDEFTIGDLLTEDWEIITEGIIKDFPITYSD